MALANTPATYGAVTRTFHWLTALLILTAIPLGLVANGLPIETDEQFARKALLFSLHKTVGVAAFFLGSARILWALTQTRPAPLHPDKRVETFAAATVHWTLYAALVLVPLSGWLHHSATTGFAPILWPFGQSLPFVPVDFRVAEFFSACHWLFTKVLAAAVLLHIAGALKHAVLDRDGTLARMVSGRTDVTSPSHATSRGPLVAACLIWLVAIGAGTALGWPRGDEAALAPQEAPAASQWMVVDGTLSVTVRQLGTEITGTFADWIAVIDFDRDADSPIKGSVEANVAIGSLTLGTVTTQALGPDFLDAAAHPTASFSATIVEDAAGDGYIALGSLFLRGIEVPLELPFSLRLDGETATAWTEVTLDRRDFGIGETLDDEASLGFSIVVGIELTALRL